MLNVRVSPCSFNINKPIDMVISLIFHSDHNLVDALLSRKLNEPTGHFIIGFQLLMQVNIGLQARMIQVSLLLESDASVLFPVFEYFSVAEVIYKSVLLVESSRSDLDDIWTTVVLQEPDYVLFKVGFTDDSFFEIDYHSAL